MTVPSMSCPVHAQGTGSPGAAPRQQPTAPSGHRQPRPADLPPAGRSTSDSSMPIENNNPNRADLLEDERLNRILNGICRGC
jgi:hypothetical protein